MNVNVTKPEHLVIQTAFLGDLLLSIPLLQNLRRLKPGDKVTLLCRKGLGDFLIRAGLVDEVIEIDKASRLAADESSKNALGLLKQRQFSLLLCVHESVRSRLLAWRLKANFKIGYGGTLNSLIFDQRVIRPMHLPEALRQLALLQSMDSRLSNQLEVFAETQKLPGGQLDRDSLVPVPEWASMRLEHFMNLRRGQSELSPRMQEMVNRLGLARSEVVFIAPGSVWPTKQWTVEGFSAVSQDFLRRGYQVILIGSREERSLCDLIAARAPGSQVVAGETSIFESVELFSQGRLLIANDSGAMHLAAVADLPTIAVFGPTILEFGYRPWQNRARVVQISRSAMKCRPCGKHGAKSCPLNTHDCMKRIPASEVVQDALRLIEA